MYILLTAIAFVRFVKLSTLDPHHENENPCGPRTATKPYFPHPYKFLIESALCFRKRYNSSHVRV